MKEYKNLQQRKQIINSFVPKTNLKENTACNLFFIRNKTLYYKTNTTNTIQNKSYDTSFPINQI